MRGRHGTRCPITTITTTAGRDGHCTTLGRLRPASWTCRQQQLPCALDSGTHTHDCVEWHGKQNPSTPPPQMRDSCTWLMLIKQTWKHTAHPLQRSVTRLTVFGETGVYSENKIRKFSLWGVLRKVVFIMWKCWIDTTLDKNIRLLSMLCWSCGGHAVA
jgi:hypothetical protein